jgi:hypothetical protein
MLPQRTLARPMSLRRLTVRLHLHLTLKSKTTATHTTRSTTPKQKLTAQNCTNTEIRHLGKVSDFHPMRHAQHREYMFRQQNQHTLLGK